MASKKLGKAGAPKSVETLRHEEAKRRNIPTAEYQSVMQKEAQNPLRIAYERRNRDLDPQLVWRGKDNQDWSDLVVQAPPLYIQEKVHPKALIDDLLRDSKERNHEAGQTTADLFSDFNGIPKGVDKTEFYQHDQNWSNRMILGDSLQVMASLAEREGLRGKVQCIYFDPPYGIKFNSNFQWSTTDRGGSSSDSIGKISREPEQVKAFRDTWRDGIHSYLTYIRDRLTVARDLLSDSGSIFVQIGDENVHRVRSLMDEVFGDENAGPTIDYKTTSGLSSDFLAGSTDHLLWYFKSRENAKYRRLFNKKNPGEEGATQFTYVQSPDAALVRPRMKEESVLKDGWQLLAHADLTSTGFATTTNYVLNIHGKVFKLPSASLRWKTTEVGMKRLDQASRILLIGSTPRYRRLLKDFPVYPLVDLWTDTGISGFAEKKIFVVQTSPTIIQRCILMTTDPGDLVLDPTCGSGTTAFVAEQWGRRWITIDTSRVALALARARVMGARYSFYLLADSRDGQLKEAEVTRSASSSQPVHGNIRHGFVYERVPHITLRSIANNAEIDVVWNDWQATLEPLREKLNAALAKAWQEWEIPNEADARWSDLAKQLHADWWRARAGRQHTVDKSIAVKAEYEYLYDKPYSDNLRVRVAGPFTAESLSPHRVLGVDENDELIDPNRVRGSGSELKPKQDFPQMILENLKTAGVQQAHKDDKIVFTALIPWPGDLVCGEGRYREGNSGAGPERRAAIFIGPEFGTVTRPDLVAAAKEAGDSDFDVLIACAFNYEAHATEFSKLGRIPVLKARMNADLHMSEELKNTGKGNLFVIFGEPDISVLPEPDGRMRIKVNGVDVFDPSSGEVRSDGADGIACWFIDTDYNEESFFVRHAYFLGANDPYGALKTTLRAEINEEAWATLHSDTSRPFMKPKHGRIAVKVINHLGDEVMRVFRV
jgi:adenine-specific DNA-methyltransferase